MDKYGRPSTKAELIAAYGEEWYADFLAKNRERVRKYYYDNLEAERQRQRTKYNHDVHKAYNQKHRELYRISSRDHNRLARRRNLDGLAIHHVKYHADNKDAAWIDDIILMTPEEHYKWHREHPEFRAEDNIVYLS